MNPSARHGGDRRSARVRLVKRLENAGENQGAILVLCSEVAEKVGLSRRSFFRAIQIATGLSEATKARVPDTWVEDHQASLQALAGLDAAMQEKVCDLLLSDPPAAGCVGDALLLARGRMVAKPDDKLFVRITSNWERMSRANRVAFLACGHDPGDLIPWSSRVPRRRGGGVGLVQRDIRSGGDVVFCPCACDGPARIPVGRDGKPAGSAGWVWNGSLTEPTLTSPVRQLNCGWHGHLRDGYWEAA